MKIYALAAYILLRVPFTLSARPRQRKERVFSSSNHTVAEA